MRIEFCFTESLKVLDPTVSVGIVLYFMTGCLIYTPNAPTGVSSPSLCLFDAFHALL